MLLAQKGQFTFAVEPQATKQAIAQAVETQFKVNVIGVTTGAIHGKTKRTGRKRLVVSVPNGKKAVVTLKAGQMIEYFKLPEQKNKKKEKKA